MFYKIRDGKNDKLLHATFYPSSMSSAYMPDVRFPISMIILNWYMSWKELTNKIEQFPYTYKKGMPACWTEIPGTWISQAPALQCGYSLFHAEYILDLMDRDVLFDLSPRLISPDGIIHDFPAFPISGRRTLCHNYLEFSSTLHTLSSPSENRRKSLLTGCSSRALIDNRPGYSYLLRTAASRLIYTLEDKNKLLQFRS